MTDDLRSWGESNTPLPDHETALAEVLSLRYRIATQQDAIEELVAGLRALFADYKLLADSGDAGFWSLEDLPIGIETLALLSKHGERT